MHPMSKTNWRKNVKAFTITSILQWFYVPIGVWVLIWRGHLSWEQIAIVSSLGLFAQLALNSPQAPWQTSGAAKIQFFWVGP